jgi:hypothetical protein
VKSGGINPPLFGLGKGTTLRSHWSRMRPSGHPAKIVRRLRESSLTAFVYAASAFSIPIHDLISVASPDGGRSIPYRRRQARYGCPRKVKNANISRAGAAHPKLMRRLRSIERKGDRRVCRKRNRHLRGRATDERRELPLESWRICHRELGLNAMGVRIERLAAIDTERRKRDRSLLRESWANSCTSVRPTSPYFP